MQPRILFAFFAFLTLAAFSQAKPLAVGDKAPDVTGVTQSGAKLGFATVYQQQPYTLVYFFPKAFTPGCTAQGCSLRDDYAKLRDAGVAVLGVSNDDAATQAAFKEKYHFPFTLIADPDHVVRKAFGVPDMGSTDLAKRQAYLIKGGKIVWADYSAATSRQAEDVLQEIARLDGVKS